MKQFKYGFDYGKFTYGWLNKDLFRLPGTVGRYNYSIKKLDLIQIGNKAGYRVYSRPMTIEQAKERTVQFSTPIKVNNIKSSDTPF